MTLRRVRWFPALAFVLAATGCDIQVASPNIVIGPTLSAGYSHSCALAANGAVFCWGSNRYGELGIGSSDTLAHRTPARVQGLPLAAFVSAGLYRTCALTTAGTAWCWGNGAGGALGNGDTLTRESPALVSGELSFTRISVGSHTCGLAGGAAYCWGNNAYGQLGTADAVTRLVPALVAGGHTFTSVSAGESHSCGVAANAVYCWGMNAHGALGSGTPTSTTAIPTAVTQGTGFTAVHAGFRYTCALPAAPGPPKCWGLNLWGELGATTPNSCLGFSDDFFPCSQTPLSVDGVSTMSIVAVGRSHTCANSISGDAYCWGANDSGQLGRASTTQQPETPDQVAGTLAFVLVTVGGTHTCGLATSSAVYCWGSNLYGQVGDNSAQDRLVPSRVTFPP